MDPEKRRALSSFYREEFLRYLDHFESTGILSGRHHACRKLITDIDDVCCRPLFPALAETLLQNFDALARLSQLDPRQRH